MCHFNVACSDERLMMDLHADGTLSTSRERTNLYLHLCELLASFALQHSFRSHFYMLSSNIANHVGTLLTARDKHLRLGECSFLCADPVFTLSVSCFPVLPGPA